MARSKNDTNPGKATARRIRFNRPVHLVMRGGLVVEMLPGEAAGAFEVRVSAPSSGAASTTNTGARRGAGRPASPATLKLRERLVDDKAAGTVGNTKHYVEFYRKAGAKATPLSAIQTVRREMRVAIGPGRRGRPPASEAATTGGRSTTQVRGRRAATKGRMGRAKGDGRGRPAAPETLILRARLEADKAKGAAHDVQHYTRWLVDQVKGLGLKPARTLVYRERRRLGL